MNLLVPFWACGKEMIHFGRHYISKISASRVLVLSGYMLTLQELNPLKALFATSVANKINDNHSDRDSGFEVQNMDERGYQALFSVVGYLSVYIVQ